MKNCLQCCLVVGVLIPLGIALVIITAPIWFPVGAFWFVLMVINQSVNPFIDRS